MGVRGEVDGSVTSRCRPRKTAVGISESMKYGTPVAAEYSALEPNSTTAAEPATSVMAKRYITTRPARNRNR